jgi:hypothetical protein
MAVVSAGLSSGRISGKPACVIPSGAGADWHARGVAKGSIMRPREINEILTGIPPLQASIVMPVGIRYALSPSQAAARPPPASGSRPVI